MKVMAKKIIEAIVNHTLVNYKLDSCNIHCINIEPIHLYGFGYTEAEAKESLQKNLNKLVDDKSNNNMKEGINGGDVEFRYLHGITMSLSE